MTKENNQPLSANYLFTLPERFVRSAAAIVGGTSLLITNTLFPDALRRSTTYRVLIGDLQKYMITRIAEIDKEEFQGTEELGDDYVRQKMAGTMLETVGLLTIRFSPLWVFAIAGDAAGGGKVFLNRLVEHLKDNDVIAQDANPQSLVDLLEAVELASHKSAKAIDRPPLTRPQLETLADDLASSYGEIFNRGGSAIPRFEAIQTRMERLAADENVSVEELSGMMAASLGKTSLGTTLALSKTSAELFGEQILSSYSRTLNEISEKGVSNYLGDSMLPFLGAAVWHLDPEKNTWTDKTLSGNKTGPNKRA